MEEKISPMNIKIISDDFDHDLFNQKASHPLQSWEWGEARKKMGIEVLRIGEFDGDNLIHVYQVTFHPIPYTHFKIGYLPRSVMSSEEVINFLYEYGRKNKVIFIKIEPYEEKSKVKSSLARRRRDGSLKSKVSPSPHPLFPAWTQMIDLTQSEDQLLQNMHAKTRYNIRLAQKKSVIIKEMTNIQGFEIFSKLYFETCKRQRYFGHNKNYHEIVFETLKNSIAHILIAFYKDIPLATYEVLIFKDVLYYTYGGSSEIHRNFMSTNLLMWEAIKWGKKRGAKKFDMWGSLPPDYDKKNPWAGFTRFKEGYGGEFVELEGSYDLVINNYLYGIYNILYTLRHIFLSLKSYLTNFA